MLVLELGIILFLVVLNGVFALAEIALVSARKVRLQQRADAGSHAARTALALAESPETFLSTVQIGITLIGILAGVFGGAGLSQTLAAWIGQFAPLEAWAPNIAMFIVVAAITYLSLIIGELVPKRLGLNNPEGIAIFLAAPMALLAWFARPIVRFLTLSSDAVLWVLRVKPSDSAAITEEDVKGLIRQGAASGVFTTHERDIVERVFKFTDQTAASIMTRRANIVWLDVNDSEEVNRAKMAAAPHSYFPVADRRLSNLLGIVNVKHLWKSGSSDLRAHVSQPAFIPETMAAATVLEQFRVTGAHLAVVVDEFGNVSGLVSISDILGALVGGLPDVGCGEPDVTQRPDGSYLIDGMALIQRVREVLKLGELPEENRGLYTTLGGYVMMSLKRIPHVGDRFEHAGYIFEVVDLDGRRVDKVLVQRAPDKGAPPAPQSQPAPKRG